jgi:spermidine/putrescine transport system permease protein
MAARRSRVLRVHMAFLFLFLYLPIAVLVVLSFNSSGLPTVWEGFSLQWYRELVGDEELLAAIKNSLIVAGFVTAI